MSDTKQMFVHYGKDYHVSPEAKIDTALPPGAYEFNYDSRSQRQWFTAIDLVSDSIIDIPSKEFEQVVNEMQFFLAPDTKNSFEKHGFIYKRSAMLYGKPGTGKTCIVQRVSQQVIKAGGVILFNCNPALLHLAYKSLDSIQPDVLTMVIFEEFDKTVNQYEDVLLSLLDGEVQKKNVMYLMTTNFIDRVPARILRPGRISSMVEVKFPDAVARKHYLDLKVLDKKTYDVVNWTEVTEGFSIDELKETVLAVCCLGQTLENVVERIASTKGIIDSRSTKKKPNLAAQLQRVTDMMYEKQESYLDADTEY
jgi:hypothetical protein